MHAATSGTVRSRYQPDDVNSLEGLTWPDTYFIGANETEEQILQKIVDQFDAKADAHRPRRLRRGQRWADAVPGAHHRVADRGRGRQQGRRAAHLGGDHQPSEGRHPAPDRRHPLLREGWVPARADRCRPQDRLAVQHLQDRRSATDPDQDGERGRVARRRSRPRRSRTGTTCPTTRARPTTR